MRKAMAEAEVGDDVFGEDPTVERLQETAAEMFEKEAALFVPSGSMGNQIAVKLHTRPGQEVVIEERGHIFNYELAGMAAISGVVARPVKSGDGTGHLAWADIEPALHVNAPYYTAPTGLLALENTHNMAGGTVMDAARTADLCMRAHAFGLPVHLDGARIFNAATALGESIAALSRHADSVMFCLSKGLGAPVGSLLLGKQEFIAEARVWRKRLGGGMRQVGVLAAAGLVALENPVLQLYEDHANARRLAEGVAQITGVGINLNHVKTNIVVFDLKHTRHTPAALCAQLKQRGILAIGFGAAVRLVTHCDVTRQDVEKTVQALNEILRA
jgi:threonine aldolase